MFLSRPRGWRNQVRLDEEPIDNIPEHATWSADEDYSQLLHDAEFMAQARTDADRLLGIIRELHHHVASQAAACTSSANSASR